MAEKIKISAFSDYIYIYSDDRHDYKHRKIISNLKTTANKKPSNDTRWSINELLEQTIHNFLCHSISSAIYTW